MPVSVAQPVLHSTGRGKGSDLCCTVGNRHPAGRQGRQHQHESLQQHHLAMGMRAGLQHHVSVGKQTTPARKCQNLAVQSLGIRLRPWSLSATSSTSEPAASLSYGQASQGHQESLAPGHWTLSGGVLALNTLVRQDARSIPRSRACRRISTDGSNLSPAHADVDRNHHGSAKQQNVAG
jgi:hypothetical protein